MTIDNTFWNGRRESDANKIHPYIPFMGACDTPALENFRVFQNLYYRYYNDGDRPNNLRVESLARKAGLEGFKYNSWTVQQDLERIGDGLIDAALAEIQSGIAQKPEAA
jgi:hypothetical protein